MRFLKQGGRPPKRQTVNVCINGYVYLYRIGNKPIAVHASLQLASKTVELEFLEFQEGVRGVRIWSNGLPIVSYVLFRDGKFIEPERYPSLGKKRAPVLNIIRQAMSKLGPDASFEQILEELNRLTLSVEQWRQALTLLTIGPETSLDKELREGDDRTLYDKVRDSKSPEPLALLLEQEEHIPFKEWLTEDEICVLSYMLGEGYEELGLEMGDKAVARGHEGKISIADIEGVRAKLQVLLAFWNGNGMQLIEDDRVRMAVLRCLPVLLRGVKREEDMRCVAQALLSRKLLIEAGWRDEKAIDMAATYAKEDVIRKMISERSTLHKGEPVPFAIDFTRAIEQYDGSLPP